MPFIGIALLNFGQAESRIAMLQDDLAAQVKEGYMRTLEDALREYKEYQALKKKLEGRRLDYDAKLARLQKAKKEKPEWEQEMQAAKLKYEETEYELLQKMVQLQEYEVRHKTPGKRFTSTTVILTYIGVGYPLCSASAAVGSTAFLFL